MTSMEIDEGGSGWQSSFATQITYLTPTPSGKKGKYWKIVYGGVNRGNFRNRVLGGGNDGNAP